LRGCCDNRSFPCAKILSSINAVCSQCADVASEAYRAQNIEDNLLSSRDHLRRLEQELDAIYGAISQDVSDLESQLGIDPGSDSLKSSSLLSESFNKNLSKKDSPSAIVALRVSSLFKSTDCGEERSAPTRSTVNL